MNQDEKMVLLIVQESLIEGDASPARQKDLAEMLERVISGGLTKRPPDGLTPGQSEQVRQMIQNALDTGSA